MRDDTEILRRYLNIETPEGPHPWYGGGHCAGTSTYHYAKTVLDALAGDDRRKDVRRVYRLFKKHQQKNDQWRVPTYKMLVYACYQLYPLFPFPLLKKYLGEPKLQDIWTP